MGIHDIRDRDRQPAFYIKIEGLPVLYGTVTPPGYTAQVGGSDLVYARKASIIPEGFQFSRQLISEDAIIESEPVSISLLTDEESGDENDPGNIFGRLGFFGADSFTQLRTAILPEDDAVTVEVSTTSGFAVDDIVHVGREACLVTEVLAAPPRLTLGERGVLGTRKQAHAVDSISGLYPTITRPIVYWRGRRVTIYEASLSAGGSLPLDTAWVERFLGVIAAEPEIAADGRAQTITLSIASIASLLDQKLGSGQAVLRLAQNVHTFDGESCNILDFGETAKIGDLVADRVQMLPDNPGDDSADTASCHLDSFQLVGHIGGGLPANHPRALPLRVFTTRPVLITGFDAAAQELIFDQEVDFTVDTEEWAENLPSSERRRVVMNDDPGSPLTAAWPEILVNKIRGTVKTNLMSGVNGGRFSIDLDLASEAAPAFIVSANFRTSGRFGDPVATCVLTNDFGKLIERCNLGQEEWAAGHIWDAAGIAADSMVDVSGAMIPREAIALDSPDGEDGAGQPQEITITVEDEAGADAVFYAPTKIASAFYRLGTFSEANQRHYYHEKYITLNADPLIPPGDLAAFEITGDEEDEPLARLVIGPAVPVIVEGVTVYRSEVDSVEVFGDSNVIADYVGKPKHRVRPIATFENVPVGVILLQLLCSLDGAGVTSASYDVLPIGAGIDEADVDIDSFLSIPNPLVGDASLRPIIRQAGTIYETMRGLLRACGYAIDLRPTDEGKCLLTATPFGIPNRAELLDHFTEADISDQPVPASIAELSIRNVFNFKANYNHKSEPKLEKSVRDTVSIEAFGEASEMDIELHGAILRDDTPGQIIEALRPCFSRLRTEFSTPRRVFKLALRSGLAAQLKIGGTYAITHRQLRGVKGLGVEGALCRLRSVDSGGFEPVASCEFVFYGFSGDGWAPSAQVTSIAGDTLTLAEWKHSPAADPVTGYALWDIDGFMVEGGKIRLHPAGDMDSYEIHTIASVNRGAKTIQLAQPSAIAAPALGSVWAWVAPEEYEEAAVKHQDYGYFDKVRVT